MCGTVVVLLQLIMCLLRKSIANSLSGLWQNAGEEEDTSPKAASVGCLQWDAFWFHIQQDEQGCGWKICL